MDVSAGPQSKIDPVNFQTDPSRYKHWRLSFDGPVATLTMDVDEKGALFEGYDAELDRARDAWDKPT